ncbi:MAG: hypothetical protein ACRD7E_29350 [Bryobacteraceae bacterium]
MSELRLGDVIDDYCIKCRRLTNHAIVSILNGEAAKVRCRSCYHDHNYLHEQVPPSKKDLKKLELFNEVLSKVDPAGSTGEAAAAATSSSTPPAGEPAPPPIEEPVPAAKKARGRAKKA